MEDVFYTYFTDVKHVVDTRQAADLTPYVKELKSYGTIQKQLRDIYTVDGKVYGIPRTGYSMGLIYNKKLFKKAGLDPDKPPTTWEEVRADAKRIAALGGGTVGYADYSAQNQGGWHFTAELYSQGGDVVSADGKKATVDTPEGHAVLRNLHDMRWTDDSMGSKQLLVINDVQQMMGSGKLGMYLSAPDNIPILVKEKGGNYQDLALGPMPGGRGTLVGGDGYMFSKKDTPAQIRAGLKWLDHMFLTPGKASSATTPAPRPTTRPSACPSRACSPAPPTPRTSRPRRPTPTCPWRTTVPSSRATRSSSSRSSRPTPSRSTPSSTESSPPSSPRRTPTSTGSSRTPPARSTASSPGADR